jgi:YhcH/YjgK/YiaL family protein
MIADVLKNLSKYDSIIPHSKEISRYLNATNISSLEIGKYQIDGESAFVLIQEYLTKTEREKEWESHRRYIDIQIVLKGQELMGYSPSALLIPRNEYSEEKDIIFYRDDLREHSGVFTPQDHFCIFFPGEAHKPGLHASQAVAIKKAVIKVSVS